jgi:hypothetical protein
MYEAGGGGHGGGGGGGHFQGEGASSQKVPKVTGTALARTDAERGAERGCHGIGGGGFTPTTLDESCGGGGDAGSVSGSIRQHASAYVEAAYVSMHQQSVSGSIRPHASAYVEAAYVSMHQQSVSGSSVSGSSSALLRGLLSGGAGMGLGGCGSSGKQKRVRPAEWESD